MRENSIILPGTSLLVESANQPRDQEHQSEDYVLITEDFLGVFDSVGGRDNGQLVSHLAGKVIAAAWRSLSEIERQGPPEQIESTLQVLIRLADTTIAELPIPPEQKRPATTAALCALSAHQGQVYATVAHTGDSRVYLLRAGQPLRRLTKDNGYFSFAVRHQKLTEEEALRIEQAEQADDLSPEQQAHFARRNKITCAVGWSDFPHIQTSSLVLLPRDRVLLCTDGVHDNLTDREIEKILLVATDEPGAQSLVNAALERSQQTHFRAKRDDMSAIVAWYRGSY